ncbi:MAG TPA: hypothetical protein VNZ49_11245 [Bacteroidia bacterium]|nr:hypothetical protein [Bacteroidia bacterium]
MKQLKKADAGQNVPANNNQQKNNSAGENTAHVAGFFNYNLFVNEEKQIFKKNSSSIFPFYYKGIFHPPCLA